MESKIYQVGELTGEIQSLLESQFYAVSVQGEISSLGRPSSGHLYFTLKDDQSQLACAFFKQAARRCPFELEGGMEVVIKGRIGVYAPRGTYQLLVDSVLPVGQGALQLAYEQLKAKLEAQGLFAATHKKPIPWFPRRIGVLTSPTGAAIQDILSILGRRAPCVPILIYPTLVQGDEAPSQICAGLEALWKQPEIDTLIIARGGGSMEDLWAFNDEKLAQTIFRCPVPIISAVGHETDFTIADFVADLRAPTPSAAAELAVPEQSEVMRTVTQVQLRLHREITQTLKQKTLQLTSYTKRLRNPEGFIFSQAQRMDELELRLTQAMSLVLSHRTAKINLANHRLEILNPRLTLSLHQQRLDALKKRLPIALQHKLEIEANRLSSVTHRMGSASPLSSFKRGYTIAQGDNGKLIRSTKQVAVKDLITLSFADGTIDTSVTKIHRSPPKKTAVT